MHTLTRIAITTSLAGLIAACSNDTSLIHPEFDDWERPVPVGQLVDPEPVDISMSYDPAPFPEPIVGPIDPPPDVAEPPPAMRIVAGYYDAEVEMGRGLFPGATRVDVFTHFVVGFADIDGDSRCVLSNEAQAALADVASFKDELPELKVLLGIRTWSADKNAPSGFHAAAVDPDHLDRFAESCSKLVDDYGLDGVNLAFPHVAGLVAVDDPSKFDMEPFPGADYLGLVGTLDAYLQGDLAEGEPERLTTVAVPPGPIVAAWFAPEQLAEAVDWIFLPAYDFEGDDDSIVRLVAPLHQPDAELSEDRGTARPTTVVSAVHSYLQAGMPAWKIVLGVTFDGRLYQAQTDPASVLYQPSAGFGPMPRGQLSWRELVAAGSEGLLFLRDQGAASPYLVDVGVEEDAESLAVVTYEDEQSIGAKRRFAVTERLAGIGAWRPTSDDGQFRLIRSLFDR